MGSWVRALLGRLALFLVYFAAGGVAYAGEPTPGASPHSGSAETGEAPNQPH
jgi:hypothetical protein